MEEKCKICGKPMDAHNFINEEELIDKGMCFDCGYWDDRLKEDKELPPHTACMIDGTHYIIADENEKSFFRGFGGSKFVIKFNDGTEVTTTNLWCQGEPSKYWKDKFPNNATFDYEWLKIEESQYLVKKKNNN